MVLTVVCSNSIYQILTVSTYLALYSYVTYASFGGERSHMVPHNSVYLVPHTSVRVAPHSSVPAYGQHVDAWPRPPSVGYL